VKRLIVINKFVG